MLYKRLTPEEISFMECWYSPVALTECLIPLNHKAPQIWSELDCELVRIRPYQFSMLDYSICYANDDRLSTKQNFQNKLGSGYLINVAARNIGKSFFAFIDAVITLLHGEGDESCIASFDFAHLKKICTPISTFVNHHPIFDLYRRKGKECVRYIGGGMEIDTVLGHVMYGRNENAGSPDPGTAFHSLHVRKLIYDEASYMTDSGRKKMIDATSSDGCLERISGIPDIRMGSPIAKMLRDESKRNWVVNMPQYVREDWDEKAKTRAIEEYDGETSPMYKLNILGEMIEGANSLFDMARIKEKSYTTKKRVKQFEVGKETFHKFEQVLIVDKQPAEISIIASDIGTTGSPSEICIFFGNQELLKWRYNISLYMLTTQEQAKVFKWLYDKLENVVISLDCTAGEGRSIADELEILGVPKDRIVRCLFNSKMIVGFETNDDQSIKYDNNGNPVYKLERTIDFAVLQLEKILYHGLIEVPHSEKFLREFANYFSVSTGISKKYGSTSTDHLLQSFQCMAIARFQTEFSNLTKPTNQNTFVAGF
jgi:hypothetical protein